jgi:hypothetical protein
VGNHSQVLVKLLLKLRDVTNVINPLVEPARKLWRDGLCWDSLICDGSQDYQKFRWGLGAVGFVHRHFSDELAGTLLGADVAVEFSRLAHRLEILAYYLFNLGARR